VEQIQLSFRDDVFPRAKFQLTEIHEQLFDHFVYGILTEKGLKLLRKYQEKTTTHE
jgi:hypothetical protein